MSLVTPDEYPRHMPHFHRDGATLFITWRLFASAPRANPAIAYGTPGQAFAAEDLAFARAKGAKWLADARVAECVAETLRSGASKGLYELDAWVIMPNHVHVLLLPMTAVPRLMQWIKGTTAFRANRILGLSGAFWEHESFDHWIRNRKELDRVIAYIENNPVSAGLCATPGEWRWSSAYSS